MWLKSGEEGGHTMSQSCLNPIEAIHSIVIRAECDGGYMYISFPTETGLTPTSHSMTQKLLYPPSGTLTGPMMILSTIISANIITLRHPAVF